MSKDQLCPTPFFSELSSQGSQQCSRRLLSFIAYLDSFSENLGDLKEFTGFWKTLERFEQTCVFGTMNSFVLDHWFAESRIMIMADWGIQLYCVSFSSFYAQYTINYISWVLLPLVRNMIDVISNIVQALSLWLHRLTTTISPHRIVILDSVLQNVK